MLYEELKAHVEDITNEFLLPIYDCGAAKHYTTKEQVYISLIHCISHEAAVTTDKYVEEQ